MKDGRYTREQLLALSSAPTTPTLRVYRTDSRSPHFVPTRPARLDNREAQTRTDAAQSNYLEQLTGRTGAVHGSPHFVHPTQQPRADSDRAAQARMDKAQASYRDRLLKRDGRLE